MTNLMALMSTLLVVFLVISTVSANTPYEQHPDSENHSDGRIFDHDVDDDYGIQADQEIMNEQLERTAESRPIQAIKNCVPTNTQGRRSRTTTKLPRKPVTTTKKFTTKKPKVFSTTKKSQYTGCGKSIHHSKIVGGTKVDVEGKFPWMVSQLFEKKGLWNHWCGGALISDRHILTAAHCLTTRIVKKYGEYVMSPSDVMIRLGESNMDIEHASPSRQDVAVSKIFVHEDWNDSTKHHDIAIIQLKERIPSWTDNIRPICLPTASALNLGGKMAKVAGWGDTSDGSWAGSNFLMEVDLPIIEFSQCKKAYSNPENNPDLYVYPIFKEQICTGFPDGEKDSCQGDSGGPLMFQRDHSKPWTVVGVVSGGIGCARAEFPGIYTRVNSYLDWIQSKMAIE